MQALPRLYAIIDRATLDARGISVAAFAAELAAANVQAVQYRDKQNAPQQILSATAEITAAFAGRKCLFLLNDRPDLARLAGWHAVHVGQNDLPPAAARRILGSNGIVGLSTHNEAQLRAAAALNPDYLAIGPVFSTATKPDAAPPVGLEGVRRARARTTKPLVAIGGITLENCRSVIDAGADSVAVIGGLFVPGLSVRAVAQDFLERLR